MNKRERLQQQRRLDQFKRDDPQKMKPSKPASKNLRSLLEQLFPGKF